jgi:hypothetical protein
MVFNIMKVYPTVEHKLQSLVTPATMMAYCLYQLFGFMLLCDQLGSPNPSEPASNFMDATRREHLFNALRESYVFPFMLTVYHALSDCEDPRRPGLKYFATLAGSRFLTDFGRLIPPQLFIIMHNISCNEDTNRNVGQAMTTLLTSTIWNTQTNNAPITPGMLLGSVNHQNRHASWFYNTIQTLFSPVTGRDLLRRSNLQDIPNFVDTINTEHTPTRDQIVNMYIMFLNAAQNAGNTANFISQMSNYVKSDFDGKFQLGAVPDDLSGVQLLVHGYGFPALPTWKFRSNAADSTAAESDSDFATRMQWMTPNPYIAGHAVTTPANNTVGFIRELYLARNHAHDENDEPDAYTQFDADLHVSPPIHFLDPYTEGSGSVAYASLSGLIIENSSFDGTSVPAPNAMSGLFHDNAHFLQGSVPLTHVTHGYATDNSFHPVPRAPHRANSQKVSNDLYDMSTNRIAQFDDHVSDALAPTTLFGFNIAEHVRSAYLMFSKFAFRTGSTPNLPGTQRFVVWSPYRYVNSKMPVMPTEQNVFMLFNFRAMYGTSVPLTRSRHPNSTLPLQ